MDVVRPVRAEVHALNAGLVEVKAAVETVATTLNTHGVTTERLTVAVSRLQAMLQAASAQRSPQVGAGTGSDGVAGQDGVRSVARVGAVYGLAVLAVAAIQGAEAARHKEVSSAAEKKQVLLEDAAKNHSDKERVRKALKRMLTSRMENATMTRKTMMNRTESLRLTRMVVEEELEQTGAAIDQYLNTSRPFSMGPPEKVVIVYKRPNKSRSLVLPHLLQDLQKICLPAYSQSLGLRLDMLSHEEGHLWLHKLECCVSAAARMAIHAALAVFFRRTGAQHRIFHRAGVGQGYNIECTVGHYAMVACFVRHALQVASGVRKAQQNGTDKGTNFQWCSELIPVDNLLRVGLCILNGAKSIETGSNEMAIGLPSLPPKQPSSPHIRLPSKLGLDGRRRHW